MSIRQNRSARRERELLRRAPPEQGQRGVARAAFNQLLIFCRLLSAAASLSPPNHITHAENPLSLCTHSSLCDNHVALSAPQRLKNALSTQKEDAL